MSEPQRLAVIWSPEARADLRAIDRETALEILYCLDRYLTTRTGGVKNSSRRVATFACAAAITASSSNRRTKTPSRSSASATAATPTAAKRKNEAIGFVR